MMWGEEATNKVCNENVVAGVGELAPHCSWADPWHRYLGSIIPFAIIIITITSSLSDFSFCHHHSSLRNFPENDVMMLAMMMMILVVKVN